MEVIENSTTSCPFQPNKILVRDWRPAHLAPAYACLSGEQTEEGNRRGKRNLAKVGC